MANEQTDVDTCIINWVTDQQRSAECDLKIKELVQSQPPTTITLYRGHTGEEDVTIRDRTWWSTTSSLRIAKKEFSKNTGNLFMIHVMNVPVLDVNRYANERGFLAKLKDYASECEYILLGGGTFYDSPEMTTVGFREENGMYSTWYRITPAFSNEERIARAMTQINGIEDAINTKNDLNTFTNGLQLTNAHKDEIMRRLGKHGGTRRMRHKRRTHHTRGRRNKRRT